MPSGCEKEPLTKAVIAKISELEPCEVCMFDGRYLDRVRVAQTRYLPKNRRYRTIVEPSHPAKREMATVFVVRVR